MPKSRGDAFYASQIPWGRILCVPVGTHRSWLCVPTDLGIRTLLFDTAAILSKHTGRARDSIQALWTHLQAGGPHVPDTSWDLEVGGHGTSEVRVEDLPHSANSSPELSIPTPLTPHGPTLSSPLSDFVWRSPAASSQPYTPYGHTPPSPLYDLVRGPPISNEDTTFCFLLNPLDPFANHRTWLHFGLVEKRHEPAMF